MIKKMLEEQMSYSGMMYTHDFKQWYNYLRCRLQNEWSTEDVSFLLGKPDFYYADFEKMHRVANFLRKESENLDQFYQYITKIDMEFHEDEYGSHEERLVRLVIEKDLVNKVYQLSIPWEIRYGKKLSAIPKLSFREWNDDDLLMESDTLLHVRLELDRLLKIGYFLAGVSASTLYIEIKKQKQVKW